MFTNFSNMWKFNTVLPLGRDGVVIVESISTFQTLTCQAKMENISSVEELQNDCIILTNKNAFQ